ncbi:Alpha-ketoglutarate-dependent dioxygenase alkB 3 [Chionoecetes opilio]|uniref:Alpha-ketoglutarate-dependent dioxygenase alkB 3 n=1 Tax=Chionoecetes opilio TaxID=41210 RepID=A0A8J5D0H8_CHIOP|nr:Alpha-ketoglutarate-dependent dioxygenase alkB 3 [Chionoecetes opilio]
MFRILRQELKWLQRHYQTTGGGGGGGAGAGGGGGEWAPLPRLLSWVGPCDLTFDGVTLEKNTSWLPEIVDLLHRLIRYTHNQYNSCLLSLFRGGQDHMAWAAEDHPALRHQPSIATLSLGQPES